MPASDTPAEDAPPAGLIEQGLKLFEGVQSLLRIHLQLLALEARRAAWGLVAIAAFSAAIGLLLALIFLGLTTALVLWLMEEGLRPSVSVLLSTLLNVGGVILFVSAIQREARTLTFPASRNSLRKLRKKITHPS
jgi:uncharacterized membrane protein YqjE